MRSLRTLSQYLQLDRRSLVAFRVVLAVGLLLDLSQRLASAAYFYSERGILPYELWESFFGHRSYYWTLHFLDGSEVLFKGVVLLQMGLAFCLLVGYRTRWVCLFSWVLLLSLVLRNPLLSYGGDKLVPILLLIAAFLPLGQYRERAPSLVARLAFLWLVVQMAVLYIASGVSKIESVYWQNGTALSNVLDMNMLVRPVGSWFGQFEPLLRFMTVTTPWAEIILPLIFFIPLWRGRFRAAAILGLLTLNVGVQTMLDVGFFMFYASAGLLALLPAVFWDDLGLAWRFTLARVGGPHISLPSSWLRMPRTAHKKVGWKVPHGLPVPPRARVVILCVVMFGFMGVTIGTGLESMKLIKLSYTSWSWTLVRGLNVYQNWGLFTDPGPTATWYVAKAKLANGTWVDILQAGRHVDWAHQKEPNALFTQNSKWRVALSKVNAFDDRDALQKAVGNALAAKWNDEHPPSEEVLELTVYKLTQPLPIEKDSGRRWQEWLVWSR